MTDDERPSLTTQQRTTLENIGDLERAGAAVTTLRVAQVLGHTRQNTRYHLMSLSKAGLIRYETEMRHTAVVELTDEGWATLGRKRPQPRGTLSFPLLGEVAAGKPTLASDQIEDYKTRLQDVLDMREGDFLLTVRDDSMIGIGIYPGDVVAIRPGSDEPINGEVVLVTLSQDEETRATLRRWHRHNGHVTLDSENPDSDYTSVAFDPQTMEVRGCLVGHIGQGRSRRKALPDRRESPK